MRVSNLFSSCDIWDRDKSAVVVEFLWGKNPKELGTAEMV